MPNFLHTNRAQLKSLIEEKAGIPIGTYILDDELNLYINEALLTYGAIANSFKSIIQIKTEIGKSIYDITTDLFDNQELLATSITYQDLLNLINYHLIEEISETNLTSEITSLDEILKFARNRINLFQYLTSHFLTRKIFNFASAGINQIVLDDEVIDIVRVAYFIDNKYNQLHKEDEQDIAFYQEKVFNTTKNRPDYYTTLLGDLNQLFIYPPPANLGTLEIISINGISSLTILDLTSEIPLANNLTPYIKYGILSDIFSKEGIGQDLSRAAYCEERWREGVQIGLNYSSILFSKLNGVPIQIDSLEAVDDQQNNWENENGKPNLLLSAGFNLLATNRVPNDIYSIDINSITNAYLPKDDSDYIDIKQEYIGPFVDYIVHLISIKSGFAAIKKTDGFRQAFVQGSLQHNLRLVERGLTYESLLKKTKLQTQEEPLKPEVVQTQSQNG